MKYLYVFLIYIIAVTGCPQIKVESTEKISFPDNGKYYHPKFDPSGEILLLTSENYRGLQLFNTGTGELIKISDGEGAGYMPVFSPENEAILFMENRFIQNRKFSELFIYDVNNRTSAIMEPAARMVTPPVVAGNRVFYKADGKLKSAPVGTDGTGDQSARLNAGIEDQQLVLYRNGESRILKPYPEESYIWPSVSPDGKRILAYAMGKGAFVCNDEGMVLKEFGKVEAPVWAGNAYIAGMVTRDDGHRILESSIVMVSIENGEQQRVSPEGLIAMYPSVSDKALKIAFNTIDGDVYIMKVHIKR